jgi:hypothetical protein
VTMTESCAATAVPARHTSAAMVHDKRLFMSSPRPLTPTAFGGTGFQEGLAVRHSSRSVHSLHSTGQNEP